MTPDGVRCRNCGMPEELHHDGRHGRHCSDSIVYLWAPGPTREELESQVAALRAALADAKQSLQWWSYTEHCKPHTYKGIPQDPCGTRAALTRINAALASTEPDIKT